MAVTERRRGAPPRPGLGYPGSGLRFPPGGAPMAPAYAAFAQAVARAHGAQGDAPRDIGRPAGAPPVPRAGASEGRRDPIRPPRRQAADDPLAPRAEEGSDTIKAILVVAAGVALVLAGRR